MSDRERVKNGCYNLAISRTAREVTRLHDHVLSPLGLTSGQFSILAMLSEEPVPGMQAIAEFMAMDRTTLVAALKPLERRGLVTSLVDPADKRRRPLQLTQEGLDLFRAALSEWEKAQATLEERHGVQRLHLLVSALN